MNKILICGNLGNDAEVRALSNGDSVISFSVATTDKWKDKNTGEMREKTEWHRCKKFSKGVPGVAQYLTKGTKVAIEGSMTYGSYEKDGVKHYTADVRVDRLELLGSKNSGSKPQDDDGLPPPGDDDNSIPF